MCAGGLWLPEMVDLACGRDEAQEPGQASRAITWDEVRAQPPVQGSGCSLPLHTLAIPA